jgi:diguanylate cyclase (GGDEF)-like protein
MLQYPYKLTTLAEVDACLADFKQRCPAAHTEILVQVFTATAELGFIRELTRKIRESVPEAAIIGMTSSGEVYQGTLALKSTVLAFQVFQKGRVQLQVFDCDQESPQQAGRRLVQFCDAQPGLVTLEILATLKNINVKPFIDEMTAIDPKVTAFGGGADAYDTASPIYVFTRDRIMEKGILVAAFSGADLHVHISTTFGWKPLGLPMKITAMDGDMVIKELNHKPAISMYQKYLNIKQDESFHRDIVEFPIFVERNGRNLARLPVMYGKDGSLIFAADFRLGEFVRLSYGDPNEIINESRQSQIKTELFHPEAVLLFSCVTRRFFLQDDVKLELEPYQQIAPSAGIYTYGELNRYRGRAAVMNTMFLAIGFREGTAAPGLAADLKTKKPAVLQDSMSLVQRLVRFINVTTAELEQANAKLARLARQDRLTALYNRGEIEAILENQLDQFRAGEIGGPVSVIMLDLDDFKKINDTYGHGLGDQALKTAAEIIMSSIRFEDAAGRWGGEEFVLVLQGLQIKAAHLVAERIRAKLAAAGILPDGKPVTASFGVAVAKKDEDYAAFYRRLDKALYEAKRRGKNRVFVDEKI